MSSKSHTVQIDLSSKYQKSMTSFQNTAIQALTTKTSLVTASKTHKDIYIQVRNNKEILEITRNIVPS